MEHLGVARVVRWFRGQGLDPIEDSVRSGVDERVVGEAATRAHDVDGDVQRLTPSGVHAQADQRTGVHRVAVRSAERRREAGEDGTMIGVLQFGDGLADQNCVGRWIEGACGEGEEQNREHRDASVGCFHSLEVL